MITGACNVYIIGCRKVNNYHKPVKCQLQSIEILVLVHMQNPEKYDKRASKFRKISDLNRRLRQGPP